MLSRIFIKDNTKAWKNVLKQVLKGKGLARPCKFLLIELFIFRREFQSFTSLGSFCWRSLLDILEC